MSTETPPAKARTQPPIDRTASEDLAHEALITLRSAQIDTTFTRGDIGPWSGLHLVTLLLVMTAIFLWALIRGAGAGLSQSDFIASPPFLATGIILLATGTSVLLATAAGPLGASHPLRSWLLTSPADRAALIRGSYRAIGIACGIIGAVALGFAVSLTGHGPIRILTSTSLGFAGGLTLTKILAVGQHRPGSEDIARLAGKVLIAIASLTLTLGILPGWSTVAELYAAPTNTWGPALDLLTTVALILLMWRLEQPMRASARHLSVGALARGGDFVDALSVSTVMLDSTPLRAITRPATRRRLHSTPTRRRGLGALLETDIRRVRRDRFSILAVLCAIPLPATASAVLGTTGGWWTALIVGYYVTATFTDGYTNYARSDSIRRSLPFTPLKARLTLLAAPTVIAATWSLIALILARVHPLTWPILITAALAGAVRSAQPRDIRSASSAMASTPMGVIPLGLLALIARGYDTLLLPGLLVAVGLPLPAFITALAPLAYHLLRNRQT